MTAKGKKKSVSAKKRERAYQAEYNRQHYKSVLLKLSLAKDTDLIEKLDGVPDKTNYIKELIRADCSE